MYITTLPRISMSSPILSVAKPSPHVQPIGKGFAAEIPAVRKSSACLAFGRKTSNNVLPVIAIQNSAMVSKLVPSQRNVALSALQESSTTSAVAADNTKAVKTAPKSSPPAKAPAKPLPQMMDEDVIPPLKKILETQDELSDIKLCFQDNRLEGSFLKKGKPHSFWAFFPNGALTGPKGFSLSSYGSGVSTVEPFLIDEKRITAKLVVFWVEKRLAAQGIIPVWND